MDTAQEIQFISNQTQITDLIEVEKEYMKNKGDITATIISLLGLSSTIKEFSKPKTVFDDVREIFDEKEELYRINMAANANAK